MLDFKIETFLCVCKHLNYTKAAEELSITQPAVSQHIKSLEQYYGQKLFTYSNKILKLTPSGVCLKNAMITMKHDSLYLKKAISETSHGVKTVSCGATLSIGEFLLPELLSAYMKSHPKIQLNCRIANTRELLYALDEGTIDFAFVEGNFQKKEYEFVTIKNERFIPVCGIDYPIGQVTAISDLFPHSLLLREEGSGSREIFSDYLSQSGYSFSDFNHCWVLNSQHTILHLLSTNCGVSFVYEMVARKHMNDSLLKEILIPDLKITHELNFIWRKNSIYKDDNLKFLDELFKTTGTDVRSSK